MRSEQEMQNLILGLAREREDVRAVWLNGSRANPNAPHDDLQDYDIVFAVTDTAGMLSDRKWMKRFGEIAVMQEPDASSIYPVETRCKDRWAFLIQFADGRRIDLTLLAPTQWFSEYRDDTLTVLLLDKDGVLPALPPASDRKHRMTAPTESMFHSCCNEFWWVVPYVAKGLWRDELLYAMDLLNEAVRPMLLKLLCWRAGFLGGFDRSAGKCCKYLPPMLPINERNALARTYPVLETAAMWDALQETMDLFSAVAPLVARAGGFSYHLQEEQGCRRWVDTLHQAGTHGHL